MILADPRNAAALVLRDKLQGRVSLPDGVVLVLGGDGFMLATVAERGFDKTYLGLNAGRIGFLMNDVEDLDAAVEAIARGKWSVYDFPVLHASLVSSDGSIREVHAVNDVVIERSTGQTAHLALAIDGTTVVDPLVADGLIFSTALGSTAYTFSAGGPACHPTLPTLAITAICAHHPRLAPFLLPETAVASVDVLQSHRRPVRALADGQTLDDVVSASVCVGPYRVRLAWLGNPDFTGRMVTKILRP